MKLSKIILFCFILFLFVGVVSAEEISGDAPVNLEDSKDVQSYNSNQKDIDDNAVESNYKESTNLKSNNLESNKIESSNKDLRSEPEDVNSFTALNETINSGEDKIDITHDYTFNSEIDTDFVYGIDICNKDITIDGHNNVIDAKNQVNVFNIIVSNVIIENLKFINAKESLFVLSNVTTINVTFENTAPLLCYSANYTSINDKFIDTYGDSGSAVIGDESNISFDNVSFKNNGNIIWSLIYTSNSQVKVLNSVFNNLTSKYATILYSESGVVEVINSTFTNLSANLTAGAIGLKSCEDVLIDNCEFNNISSVKNGGAIFTDINGGGDSVSDGRVLINNTLFDNCHSDFGGAYLQLGGYLTIINSNFTDNVAGFDGGAVYTSFANVTILNSSFVNNRADLLDSSIFHGAAILIDNGALIVGSSNFTGNKAINGAAIYLYDSGYNITNSNFTDNTMALLTYFDDSSGILDNNVFNDEYSLNNTFYDFNARGVGKEIVLNPTIINASATDSYLDLRKLNLTSPVKNQGNMGSCWAFGSVAAIESAFLKATGILLDISENNIQDSGLAYSIYGMPIFFEGASTLTALSYCLSWLGVLPAKDDVYDELGKISPLIYDSNAYHILDAIMIQPRDPSDENQTADVYKQLKEALIKYGALAVWVNADFNKSNYNETYNSAYCDDFGPVDHIVCLVGWNDTFSKDHFTNSPPGDGAWIIKNSWGADWGDDGYYYVSYYDTAFSTNWAVGYIINNTVLYDTVYQYDVISLVQYVDVSNIYRDVFVADANGLLSAVGTYFNESNVDYTVNIYISDDIVYSQSGKSLWPGYHTIKLDKTISLTESVTFAVEIESNSVPTLVEYVTREHFPDGVSFIRVGSELIDISVDGDIACVKAYVINSTIVANDLVKDFGDNKQFTVNVTDPNKQVIFEIDGKNYTVTSDSECIASLDMNFNPGTYIITTYYGNLSIINKVTIKESPAYKLVTQQNQTINDLKGKVNTTETEFKKADDKNKELTKQVATLTTQNTNLQNQLTATNSKSSDASANLKKVSAKSKVKKSKNFKITATLNKKVKGKYVYVVFNGKSYKAKTDKNGVAKITIKKSALKKLAGKKVKYQVMSGQKLINKTVKIKK